jgi:hypothetical protein
MAVKNEQEEQAKKKSECLRVCGEAGKRGVHKMAPEMCPVLDEQWKTRKSLGGGPQ